jgi:hypothetical protein
MRCGMRCCAALTRHLARGRYASSQGSPSAAGASRDYNHGCRAGTLTHAVAAPLRELAAAGEAGALATTSAAAPFAPLLRTHFTRKAASLRAACDAWAAEAAADRASAQASSVRAAADAARAALAKPLPAAAEEEADAPGTPESVAERVRRWPPIAAA